MPVTIGVDPHKASHTAAALDEHGQLLDQLRIPATLDGYRQLRQWAGRWPQRCWAVEGAHGIGRALAQRLVATASRSWRCRPSWPPGSGSYQLGMAARATPMMPSRWQSPPATHPHYGRSVSRTRRPCCTC